ncbi:MAG: hypothetical protein JJ971_10490 [Balneolaceae bacterium]|nr:hypothetical protein [Balneolaceae bacterium]MBO6546327.1 hypothetical protein [Balneolaceae bacterium]MBO6648686.1 hypothetical protein [Balneolaceae bacterium]
MNRIIITILFSALIQTEISGQELIREILDFGASEKSQLIVNEYNVESEIYRNDYGLSFNASAQHRFGEGFIEADLTENNAQTFYKAGLSWNLLKGGWYQNQSKADQLDLIARLEAINSEKESKARAYYAQYSLTAYLYDNLLLDVYLSREELLKTKQRLFSSLRKEGYFTNQEVLELEKRRNEVSFQTKNISQSNQAFISIFGNPLIFSGDEEIEIPSISIAEILNDIDQSQFLESSIDAQKRINKEPVFWAEEVIIKASLNYNHQVSFVESRRDFVSAGVSISVPVHRTTGLKKQKYQLANKKIEEEHLYLVANLKKELLVLYQEYVYKEKQLTNIISTTKILEEKFRVQQIHKQSMNSELPATDASLLQDDLLSLKIEEISLSKQMMQILVKMNVLLPDNEITHYLEYTSPVMLSAFEEVE